MVIGFLNQMLLYRFSLNFNLLTIGLIFFTLIDFTLALHLTGMITRVKSLRNVEHGSRFPSLK